MLFIEKNAVNLVSQEPALKVRGVYSFGAPDTASNCSMGSLIPPLIRCPGVTIPPCVDEDLNTLICKRTAVLLANICRPATEPLSDYANAQVVPLVLSPFVGKF
mgnify:CR=1 FL=1